MRLGEQRLLVVIMAVGREHVHVDLCLENAIHQTVFLGAALQQVFVLCYDAHVTSIETGPFRVALGGKVEGIWGKWLMD